MAGKKRAQQGSKAYMMFVVENYEKRIDSGNLTPSQEELLLDTMDAIEKALQTPDKRQYIAVTQKFTNAGLAKSLATRKSTL